MYLRYTFTLLVNNSIRPHSHLIFSHIQQRLTVLAKLRSNSGILQVKIFMTALFEIVYTEIYESSCYCLMLSNIHCYSAPQLLFGCSIMYSCLASNAITPFFSIYHDLIVLWCNQKDYIYQFEQMVGWITKAQTRNSFYSCCQQNWWYFIIYSYSKWFFLSFFFFLFLIPLSILA